MRFTKMQGAGNDYVYVNCFSEKVEDPSALAIKVSNRNFGVGSDGLILICPSDIADCRMDMYNSDGSRSQMCGNGVRCVGRFYHDRIEKKDTITVDTLAGIKILKMHYENGIVSSITVDMGEPELKPELIPVNIPGEKAVDVPVTVDGVDYRMTCVSMGNPHAIVFVDDVDAVEIEKTGPLFENHELFPERTNTEFLQMPDEHNINMRVWERGAGETLACGTGACASLVAATLLGKCDGKATLHLRGGNLEIEWNKENGHVFMTGPAEFVFDGELLI